MAKIGMNFTYTGRIFNPKQYSKGMGGAVSISKKVEDEWISQFINFYYNGEVLLEKGKDYKLDGFVTIDEPYGEREAQLKLIIQKAEPVDIDFGNGSVDRTKKPQPKAQPTQNYGF